MLTVLMFVFAPVIWVAGWVGEWHDRRRSR